MAIRRARTLVLGITLLGASAVWSGEPTSAIVAHPSRAAAVSLHDLRRVFLKQRRFWADGEPIVVLNRPAGTALRDAFTRAVLGQTADQAARYWNEQYFRGVLPPITFSSDRAIVRYVAVRPNAIGYVDARTVDDSVRVLQRLRWRGPPLPTSPTPSAASIPRHPGARRAVRPGYGE